MSCPYDAILLVSFGGPQRMADVMPFLENVLRGKNVPRERMLEVAKHYEHFDGVSPINEQNCQLIAALEEELATSGPDLPIYWGNRNWHPLLPDTLRRMSEDGRRSALAVVTSAYSSYSGCRQYREDIERAQNQVGPRAPRIDKLRVFYNHPGFIDAMTDRVQAAVSQIPAERKSAAVIAFTAHSIPTAVADGCRYVEQLTEACRLVIERIGEIKWDLVYQSRSGPPNQSWLEPDVCDQLRALHSAGVSDVVVSPIGFLSDHLEVLYDLDSEAAELCRELGIHMVRAATVGTHPRFVEALGQLIRERCNPGAQRTAIGRFGPSHDVCPEDCCLSGRPRPGSN